MVVRRTIRKTVNEKSVVRCADGTTGVLREEVYVDLNNQIVKYNLAFIHFGKYQQDNGRVLGYDNAHGVHERHYMGTVKEIEFSSYPETLNRFLAEVTNLKE